MNTNEHLRITKVVGAREMLYYIALHNFTADNAIAPAKWSFKIQSCIFRSSIFRSSIFSAPRPRPIEVPAVHPVTIVKLLNCLGMLHNYVSAIFNSNNFYSPQNGRSTQ